MAIVSALAYLVGVALLVAFLRSRDRKLVPLAVLSFLWTLNQLLKASFFWEYYGTFSNAPISALTVDRLIWGMLLIYLCARGGRHRSVLWGVLGAYGVCFALEVIVSWIFPYFSPDQQLLSFVSYELSDWAGFAGLVTLLVLSIGFWRRESRFWRILCPLNLGALWSPGSLCVYRPASRRYGIWYVSPSAAAISLMC